MINIIDEALDSCQRALLVLNAYEHQKESGSLKANDEALSIRMVSEYLCVAVNKLGSPVSCHEIRKDTKHSFTPLNSFAARLRLAIAHSGMTQAALASGVGVSQSTISALVTGKSKEAGVVRARAISEALEVNAKWLLYGEGGMCSKQSESFESQAARIKFSGSNS